jgi:signal transduction histidine kinase
VVVTTPAADLPSMRTQRLALCTIVCAWIGVSIIQVAASFLAGDPHKNGGLWIIIARTALANAPFAVYCVFQFRSFWSVGIERLGLAAIAQRLVIASLVGFLPLVFFQAAINTIILGAAPWASWPQAIAAYAPLLWIFDCMIFVGCFAATLAPRLWVGHRQAEAARETAVRENLALRLALQEQNLKTLQRQLEPHFLFNALHAISALVRGDNKRGALTAISTLSKLLRHAVESSDGRLSTLNFEIAFIRDYLELQVLRFEDRLTYMLQDPPEQLLETTLPALLMQPLVENAVRHEVECHSGPSHIEVEVAERGGSIHIRVSNTANAHAASNPGSGMGLKNIRERLALVYGESARLEVVRDDGKFHATLTLPKDQEDE